MVSNPTLTHGAGRGRDDALVTALVTGPGTASGRPGTRWWNGMPR